MRTSALAIVAFLWGLSLGRLAAAQNPRKDIPLASVQYFYAGRRTIPQVGGQGTLEVENHILLLRALYGHLFKSSLTALAAEAGYEMTVGASRLAGSPWRRDTYHYPNLRLAVLQGFDRTWGLTAFGIAGVASDLHGYAAEDWRFTFGLAGTYSTGPNLRIVLGALVTNLLDPLIPVWPLLDVKYRVGRTMLRVSIPNGGAVWYSLTESLDLGLVAGRVYQRYTLHGRDRVADQYGELNIALGPAVRFFLGPGFYLQAEGGYNLYRFRLRAEETITYERFSWSGWYVSGWLGYML